MKKIIPIFIIGTLIFCGFGVAAFNSDNFMEKELISKSNSTSFQFSSKPILCEKEESVQIEINGTTSQLLEPNKPVLPIFVKLYQLPYGSKNIKVICNPKDIGTIILTKKIISARIAPLSKINNLKISMNDCTVYNSSAFYPNNWYKYDISAGCDSNNTEVIFVKIICYPIRYSPANDQIDYTTHFDIIISYDTPMIISQTIDEYDMVIIAPKSFESNLQPLIDFKNSKGLKTTFKSVEDIFNEYNGADPPEQVKYFIKYAYDTWGIKYVMLVGGLKSHIYAKDKDTGSAGWKAWWVPVRYVNIPEEDDEGCLSDLYYGCLYNATGAFDSWDSNHDGVYAAWGAPGVAKDTFDMNPEVYVSRLPVANKIEVSQMVKKIITYERSGPDAKPWYKNFIGIGGKTFDYYEGKPDGEYLCDLEFNYTKNAIPDLNLVTVYSTNRNTSGFVPIAKDIQKAISQGAGYVDFEGHGNPLVWDTIWFDGSYPNDWCGGIHLYNFLKISNGAKLPVVIVGGCHNGLYNVSLFKTLFDKAGTQYFCYGIPIPVCFSWGLVVKSPGGAIASTGCTGYGMGYEGNPVSLTGELESNFFYEIGNGATYLAQAHSRAIQKLLAEKEIGQIEAFCITNWALFGDPSLRLGGYPS
ncbi:Peptidase family C25 [uncultured archaeon]|nr:Peptidase family C25 [uncultured archaeon]